MNASDWPLVFLAFEDHWIEFGRLPWADPALNDDLRIGDDNHLVPLPLNWCLA